MRCGVGESNTGHYSGRVTSLGNLPDTQLVLSQPQWPKGIWRWSMGRTGWDEAVLWYQGEQYWAKALKYSWFLGVRHYTLCRLAKFAKMNTPLSGLREWPLPRCPIMSLSFDLTVCSWAPICIASPSAHTTNQVDVLAMEGAGLHIVLLYLWVEYGPSTVYECVLLQPKHYTLRI